MQNTDRNDAVRYDVVVVGGGVAGLSAALVLGRSRRRTLVLEAGAPRNAPSSGVHGFFSRDGMPPKELLRIGREQLGTYRTSRCAPRGPRGPGERTADSRWTWTGGASVRARKLLLATGVADELPETPGFRELWGRGVYHCPYCHSWEVRDRPLAVYVSDGDPAGPVDRAVFIRNWSRDLVVLTDGPSGLDAAGREKLDALGVSLNEKPIARLEGGNDVSEGLARIVFEDGSTLAREGIFYGPPQRQSSGLAETLAARWWRWVRSRPS